MLFVKHLASYLEPKSHSANSQQNLVKKIFMKNYVISLKNAHQRRQHIVQEFGRHGIDFEFFDAITPSQVPLLAQKFDINIQNSELTPGELACLFSHIALWQKAKDENIQHLVVFEDDVYLGENTKLFLENANWIPNACGLLKIEHFIDRLHLGKAIHTFQGRQIKQLQEFNWGTAGYIIYHDMIDTMMTLLKDQFDIKNLPIDHLMFEVAIEKYPSKIYQLSPALCVQSDRPRQQGSLLSTLEAERQTKRASIPKAKLAIHQKISKELTRPFMQLKDLLTKQTVKFK